MKEVKLARQKAYYRMHKEKWRAREQLRELEKYLMIQRQKFSLDENTTNQIQRRIEILKALRRGEKIKLEILKKYFTQDQIAVLKRAEYLWEY